MTRPRVFWMVAVLLVGGWGLAAAETIVLKDGTRYEGQVVSEDATTIELSSKHFGVDVTRRIPKDLVAERQGAAASVPPAEQVTSAEEAIKTAAQLFAQGQLEPSKSYIARACQLDEGLLKKIQSFEPAAWRDFWHSQVLSIRQAKVEKTDLAGQLELARFAEQAGLQEELKKLARGLLAVAQNQPEVVALARRMGIDLTRPVELDFTYALDNAVLLDQFVDEGVTIEPLRGNRFLLAPFHYEAGERRYMISVATKVETEAGKRCRVRGIAVTEGTGGGREGGYEAAKMEPRAPRPQDAAAGAQQQAFSLPGGQAPLYERIQPELKDGAAVLLWQNTFTPRPPREPTAAPAGRGTQMISRDGTGRISGAPRSPEPTIQSREQPQVRRGEMPASGWGALVIDYPQEATQLTVQLVGEMTETVDLALLELVQGSGPSGSAGSEDPSQIVMKARQVSQYAAAGSPGMARLAVAWLARVSDRYQAGRGGEQQADVVGEAIERGLLAGVGNADATASQAAWASLSLRQGISPATVQYLAREAEASLLERLMQLIGQELAAARTGGGTEARPSAAPVSVGKPGEGYSGGYSGRQEQLPMGVPSALPDSGASAVCFGVLQAVLQSAQSQCVQEAVTLILEDGSKQAVGCLAEAPLGAKEVVLGQVGSVASEEVKSTVIKTMLLTPVPAIVERMVEAKLGSAIVVTDPADPVLMLPGRTTDRKTRVLLLGLLREARMQGVLDSPAFTDMVRSLTGGLAEPEVRRAVYEMMTAQWLKAGGGPEAGQPMDTGRGGSSTEQLLTEAVLQPDEAVQMEAAGAMLKTGRVETLIARLTQNVPAAQVAGLLGRLAMDPQFRGDDETFALFGAMVGHSDAGIARAALAAISLAGQQYPAEARWRMRLAIKRELSLEGLVQRMADAQAAVAKMAVEVAGMLSGGQLGAGDGKAAGDRLRQLDSQRSKDPSGEYHLLLTAWVNLPEYELVEARGGLGLRELGSLQWRPVKATKEGRVTISKESEGRYVVQYEGRQIGASGQAVQAQAAPGLQGKPGEDAEMGGKPRRGGRGGPGGPEVTAMAVDAAGLVEAALASEAEGKQVRVPSPLAVGLEYLVLGTWEGRWQRGPQQAGPGAPADYDQQFRVDSQGKVILGKLPQPQFRQVWLWLEPVQQEKAAGSSPPTGSGSSG